MPKEVEEQIEAVIEADVARWIGVVPPSPVAQEFAKGMAALIASFEKLRGELQFEDEPSSFEAALQETKERTP